MTTYETWIWQFRAIKAIAAEQERRIEEECRQALIRERIKAAFPSAGKQFFSLCTQDGINGGSRCSIS